MASLPNPVIPVSWGELLDKITILEIKNDRIASPDARANVMREYEALLGIGRTAMGEEEVVGLVRALRHVNEELWEIEDAIRAEEARGRFGPSFIRLARAVYRKNDERAALKRRINQALGSDLIEEKSYWSAS